MGYITCGVSSALFPVLPFGFKEKREDRDTLWDPPFFLYSNNVEPYLSASCQTTKKSNKETVHLWGAETDDNKVSLLFFFFFTLFFIYLHPQQATKIVISWRLKAKRSRLRRYSAVSKYVICFFKYEKRCARRKKLFNYYSVIVNVYFTIKFDIGFFDKLKFSTKF